MPRGFWVSYSARTKLAISLAVLCVAMLVLLQGKPSFTNASRPRFGDPGLAIQFPRSIEDIDYILGDAPSPDREVMRIKQYIDFGFIAAYTSLFLVLSTMVTAKGEWKRVTGIAAGICGVATGVFDVVEDLSILRILDVPLYRTTPAMINAIRSAAIAKWTLAAATVLLLCTYFIRLPKTS